MHKKYKQFLSWDSMPIHEMGIQKFVKGNGILNTDMLTLKWKVKLPNSQTKSYRQIGLREKTIQTQNRLNLYTQCVLPIQYIIYTIYRSIEHKRVIFNSGRFIDLSSARPLYNYVNIELTATHDL